jgi:5-methylcytosine-specific restriction endonuclease McrA
MAMRACVQCGGQFKARASGRPQRYCGAVCRNRIAYLKANPLTAGACAKCDGPLPTGAHGNRTYCSSRCRWASENEGRYQPRRYAERPCAVCAKSFTPIKWHARYCSSKCNHVALMRDPHRRTSTRAYGYKRRALKRGASNGIVVVAEVILRRDGWTCQICGIKTPEALRGKRVANAPELDHIIPLSRGGAHTPDNLQCACLACNRRKGARVAGQLRLVLGESRR